MQLSLHDVMLMTTGGREGEAEADPQDSHRGGRPHQVGNQDHIDSCRKIQDVPEPLFGIFI